MFNIFEELKDMGFENVDKVELYASKDEKKGKGNEEDKKPVTVEDILYNKKYVCPICGKEFTSKAIKSGKNRLLTVDLDLKANYDIVNPLIYDCIVCENCGYAALSKNFNSLSSSQIMWIREQVCTKYKVHHYPEVITIKDAIVRYKLALLNATVKKAKDGEKAYICLKIAWLYRDMGEKQLEEQFLKYALSGFENAYANERFPIFELGELTVAYIIACINKQLGDYDKAMKWVSFVVVDRSVPLRLKTKALHLKSVIIEEKEKSKNSNTD